MGYVELNTRSSFIAVDWGTTNFRAYFVDENLSCLENSICRSEILGRESDEFSSLLRDSIGVWRLKEPQVPIVLTGMIGSSLGWQETPFMPCPAGVKEIGAGLCSLDEPEWPDTWIVPGIQGVSASGHIDIMRGEECQIVGAMSLLQGHSSKSSMTICLPGTHSKWVSVYQGNIVSFSTHMTGEMHDVIRRHSILSQSVDQSGEIDEGAFILGLECSQQPGGILHHLFSLRSRNLLGNLNTSDGESYLSGMLIGCELTGQSPQRGTSVTVVASEKILPAYVLALDYFGLGANPISAQEATIHGVGEILRGRTQ